MAASTSTTPFLREAGRLCVTSLATLQIQRLASQEYVVLAAASTSATIIFPHFGGATSMWISFLTEVCAAWSRSRTANRATFRAVIWKHRVCALHLPTRPRLPCRRRTSLRSERREALRPTSCDTRTTAHRPSPDARGGVVKMAIGYLPVTASISPECISDPGEHYSLRGPLPLVRRMSHDSTYLATPALRM